MIKVKEYMWVHWKMWFFWGGGGEGGLQKNNIYGKIALKEGGLDSLQI